MLLSASPCWYLSDKCSRCLRVVSWAQKTDLFEDAKATACAVEPFKQDESRRMRPVLWRPVTQSGVPLPRSIKKPESSAAQFVWMDPQLGSAWPSQGTSTQAAPLDACGREWAGQPTDATGSRPGASEGRASSVGIESSPAYFSGMAQCGAAKGHICPRRFGVPLVCSPRQDRLWSKPRKFPQCPPVLVREGTRCCPCRA